MSLDKITTCLWFDSHASEAATFYASIFPSSSITHTSHYTSAGQAQHNKPPGSVMMVSFRLNSQPFMALNGGPDEFKNASTSFVIECEDQAEIDYYWGKLGEGTEGIGACGWLKDKYGVLPKQLGNVWLRNGDEEKFKRVMEAMLKMGKLEIEELKKAFNGVE
ncbi:hypothetical protein N0V90_006907 [Kalmusia sp. IMI 367209]|nr:hypothetical protein N0V90_006907 [Kalmusia sp. IMI 367209]